MVRLSRLPIDRSRTITVLPKIFLLVFIPSPPPFFFFGLLSRPTTQRRRQGALGAAGAQQVPQDATRRFQPADKVPTAWNELTVCLVVDAPAILGVVRTLHRFRTSPSLSLSHCLTFYVVLICCTAQLAGTFIAQCDVSEKNRPQGPSHWEGNISKACRAFLIRKKTRYTLPETLHRY